MIKLLFLVAVLLTSALAAPVAVPNVLECPHASTPWARCCSSFGINSCIGRASTVEERDLYCARCENVDSADLPDVEAMKKTTGVESEDAMGASDDTCTDGLGWKACRGLKGAVVDEEFHVVDEAAVMDGEVVRYRC